MLSALLGNPIGYLTELALRLPAVLMAICLHESAHGWVANRCGDPTARLMGRITLNPAKHFDLMGMLCMFFVGIGWAKPVPVNPNNFKNYRRDDLLVSLAGITMNLILALLSMIGLYAFFTAGFRELVSGYSLRDSELLWYQAAAWQPQVIEEFFGPVYGYLYQMLSYMVTVNLSLAIFNLLPVPPLDGYHVVNDLLLKRPLFVERRFAMMGQGVMFLLLFTGILSRIMGFALTGILNGTGYVAFQIARAVGAF